MAQSPDECFSGFSYIISRALNYGLVVCLFIVKVINIVLINVAKSVVIFWPHFSIRVHEK